MNEPLIIIGSFVTVVILLFALIAKVDGFKAALVVMGGTLVLMAVIAGIMAFWFWVGGAFA